MVNSNNTYYIKNREKILEKSKLYNIENKEKVIEYQKKYRLLRKKGIKYPIIKYMKVIIICNEIIINFD